MAAKGCSSGGLELIKCHPELFKEGNYSELAGFDRQGYLNGLAGFSQKWQTFVVQDQMYSASVTDVEFNLFFGLPFPF